METVGQISVNLMTLTCMSWCEGQCDLFHGPVILPYILKTIGRMNIKQKKTIKRVFDDN